jgi:HSP20 family molecular chaperone IbpA
MKNPAQIRGTTSRVAPPALKRKRAAREALPLRNLPDCLLAAYDGVSRRAFERFVARGSKAGSEISDWRSAENDLFLPIHVELQETDEAIYALATVEELTAAEISVAVEDRWLLISGHPECRGRIEEGARGRGRESMRWIDWDDLYSVLKDSEAAPEVLGADAAGASLTTNADSRPFCVVELPAGVDAGRSVAVMADGLVAVRMPKVAVVVPVNG